MIPIRCITCNKIIAHLYQLYLEKIRNGEHPQDILNEFGMNKYCCRKMFITNIS
jgi:DNA-directed RNA polymerase subunit N